MSTTDTQTPIQVIEPQRTETGLAFELPFDAADVAKMEAVDLDLLITLQDGQQYILTQAGLLAMTQPDSVLRYAGGEEVLAADEVKTIGALQPMDANSLRLAGNFRLASVDLDENGIDRVSGTGFGLGQELVDITAKLDQSSQKIEQILESLEQATQASSLASSGDEPPPETATGVKRLSKNTNPELYASPTPGAPPQQERTEEQTNENNVQPEPPGSGGENARMTFKLLAANLPDVTLQGAALGDTEASQLLGDTEVRQIYRESEVVLKMEPNATDLIFEAGKVNNQLLLEAVPTTDSLTLTIGADEKVPSGLTINGQALTAGSSITVSTVGMVDNQLRLNMQWDEEGADNSNFQLSVFSQASDQRPLQVIGFIGDSTNAYTLDLNGQPRLFVASEAMNLVVEGNASNNTITTGNGDDRIIGSAGADAINGGGGFNTVDYSQSTGPVTVNLHKGEGEGSFAEGDTYTNIQRVIGTDGDDTFFAKTAADQFVGGAGNDTVDYSNLTDGVTIDIANNLHQLKRL